VAGTTAAFLISAIIAYDPTRGLIARRGALQPGGSE
jgi:ABC-2 type transport system permease protein